MRIIKNKTAPIFFILIIINLILGCSPQKQDNSQINNSDFLTLKQTPINWIGTWQKRISKRNLVTSAVREFEILHQDIKVNIKYQEEFCGGCSDARVTIQDTIINIIQSGNYYWDIIPLTQKYYSEIARLTGDPEWGKKYLVNFEEFEWFRNSHISQVFEVSKYREDFGGILAGPMIEGRYYGLWYNTETAKKIGLNVKNLGMTYDDLLSYCKKVQEYNKTSTDKITFFTDIKVNEQVTDLFNSLVLSELGQIGNAIPKREIALAAIRKSLNAIEELAKYNAIEPSVKLEKEIVPYLDGKALFTVQVSSWYNQCESEDLQKAQNMIPAEMPVFKNSVPIYHGSYQSVWAVFKNAPHRDQAIELMKFICSNDVAERWLSTTYNPTGLKVRLNASDFGQNDIEKFNQHIEQKYGNNIRNFDLNKILFGRTIKTNLDPTEIFQGKISAEAFYNKFVSQL